MNQSLKRHKRHKVGTNATNGNGTNGTNGTSGTNRRHNRLIILTFSHHPDIFTENRMKNETPQTERCTAGLPRSAEPFFRLMLYVLICVNILRSRTPQLSHANLTRVNSILDF